MSNRQSIEAFVAQKARSSTAMPKQALEDMRYFAKRAKEGAVVSITGLTQWMEEKHGIRAGRTKLYNEMVKLGERPWWAK